MKNDQNFPEQLLRPSPTAKMLGISDASFWAKLKTREIPLTPLKLSKRVTVFRLSEIMAFIDSLQKGQEG